MVAFETKPGVVVSAVHWPGLYQRVKPYAETPPDVLQRARQLVRGQVPNHIEERGDTGLRIRLTLLHLPNDGWVDVPEDSWIVMTPEDGTIILHPAAFLALFVPVPMTPEAQVAFREGFTGAVRDALSRGVWQDEEGWGRLGGDGPDGG